MNCERWPRITKKLLSLYFTKMKPTDHCWTDYSNSNLVPWIQHLTSFSPFFPFWLHLEQWPCGYGAGFPIHGSRVQNHWVAPTSTQPFILPRSIKWVPGHSRDWGGKSKLPPRSYSVALKQLSPIHKIGP